MLMLMPEIQRVNLYCPYCGAKGDVYEVLEDMAIPALAERVSKHESHQCKLCGGVFYKDAYVIGLMLRLAL